MYFKRISTEEISKCFDFLRTRNVHSDKVLEIQQISDRLRQPNQNVPRARVYADFLSAQQSILGTAEAAERAQPVLNHLYEGFLGQKNVMGNLARLRESAGRDFTDLQDKKRKASWSKEEQERCVAHIQTCMDECQGKPVSEQFRIVVDFFERMSVAYKSYALFRERDFEDFFLRGSATKENIAHYVAWNKPDADQQLQKIKTLLGSDETDRFFSYIGSETKKLLLVDVVGANTYNEALCNETVGDKLLKIIRDKIGVYLWKTAGLDYSNYYVAKEGFCYYVYIDYAALLIRELEKEQTPFERKQKADTIINSNYVARVHALLQDACQHMFDDSPLSQLKIELEVSMWRAYVDRFHKEKESIPDFKRERFEEFIDLAESYVVQHTNADGTKFWVQMSTVPRLDKNTAQYAAGAPQVRTLTASINRQTIDRLQPEVACLESYFAEVVSALAFNNKQDDRKSVEVGETERIAARVSDYYQINKDQYILPPEVFVRMFNNMLSIKPDLEKIPAAYRSLAGAKATEYSLFDWVMEVPYPEMIAAFTDGVDPLIALYARKISEAVFNDARTGLYSEKGLARVMQKMQDIDVFGSAIDIARMGAWGATYNNVNAQEIRKKLGTHILDVLLEVYALAIQDTIAALNAYFACAESIVYCSRNPGADEFFFISTIPGIVNELRNICKSVFNTYLQNAGDIELVVSDLSSDAQKVLSYYGYNIRQETLTIALSDLGWQDKRTKATLWTEQYPYSIQKGLVIHNTGPKDGEVFLPAGEDIDVRMEGFRREATTKND
jgi:hypothetical protein